jgi:hypothetical protein
MEYKEIMDSATRRAVSMRDIETEAGLERRKKSRINEPIPIIVRGSDAYGKAYRFKTIARNIGSGGVCASAPRVMEAGEMIHLHVRFALAGSKPSRSPAIAARAVVLRAENQPDGSSEFAASFLLHRFL